MDDKLAPSPRSNKPIALVIALLACGALIVGIRSMNHDDSPDTTTTPVSAPVKVNLRRLPASSTCSSEMPIDMGSLPAGDRSAEARSRNWNVF